MRSKSIRFMAIGLTVLATEVARAVGLSEVTVKDGVITIGSDANFAKFEGWLPWLKPYSGSHEWGTDQKAVLWTNRKLADVKALKCKMNGGWIGSELDGRGLITKRSDEQLEVQFQSQHGDACKTVLAYLEQDGDNIVGWAKQAGYSTEVKTGAPIPSFWLQVSSTKDNGAYGVYGIEVENTLETTPAELKALAASVGEAGTDTLTVNDGVLAIRPTEANEVFDLNITGNAVVCFAKGAGTQGLETLGGGDNILTTEARTIIPGYRLADVEFVSAKTGGSWMGIGEAQIYYMNQSADKWTFQAQKTGDGWAQCVLVELTDGAEGVQGRIVWGRYKEHARCPLGSDFTAIDGYYTYKTVPNDMQASLSALVLKVPPSLVFSATKSNWTTWGTIFDGGTVRVSKNPLPSNPCTFVEHGGVLRLEVSGGAWWGGDSRFYTVGKDSLIVLIEGLAMANGATLTLDGGQIQVMNGFNYVNDLTIKNGGGWVGSQCCRAGYAWNVAWTIEGPDPVTIEPGLELVRGGDGVITLKTEVDTLVAGALRDAGGYEGATFAKDGAAKLTLGSANANAGPVKVVAGELVFANANGIRSNNALVLAGGKVSLGTDVAGVSAGALTLSGSAALDATNGTFAFADSHEAEWSADAVLKLVCDPSKRGRKNRFRFGTTANGLTADQLSRIRYDESVTTRKVTFTLDADGYLCDSLDQGFTLRIR